MSRTALRSKRIYTGLTAELTDGYVIWEDGKILFAGPATLYLSLIHI